LCLDPKSGGDSPMSFSSIVLKKSAGEIYFFPVSFCLNKVPSYFIFIIFLKKGPLPGCDPEANLPARNFDTSEVVSLKTANRPRRFPRPCSREILGQDKSRLR
jgi:hypothetical protein